jgi:hypothetical protein
MDKFDGPIQNRNSRNRFGDWDALARRARRLGRPHRRGVLARPAGPGCGSGGRRRGRPWWPDGHPCARPLPRGPRAPPQAPPATRRRLMPKERAMGAAAARARAGLASLARAAAVRAAAGPGCQYLSRRPCTAARRRMWLSCAATRGHGRWPAAPGLYRRGGAGGGGCGRLVMRCAPDGARARRRLRATGSAEPPTGPGQKGQLARASGPGCGGLNCDRTSLALCQRQPWPGLADAVTSHSTPGRVLLTAKAPGREPAESDGCGAYSTQAPQRGWRRSNSAAAAVRGRPYPAQDVRPRPDQPPSAGRPATDRLAIESLAVKYWKVQVPCGAAGPDLITNSQSRAETREGPFNQLQPHLPFFKLFQSEQGRHPHTVGVLFIVLLAKHSFNFKAARHRFTVASNHYIELK